MSAPGKTVLPVKYKWVPNLCRACRKPTTRFFVFFTNSFNPLDSFFVHFLHILHCSCSMVFPAVVYVRWPNLNLTEIFLPTQREKVFFLGSWKGTCKIVRLKASHDRRMAKCFIHLIWPSHFEYALSPPQPFWTEVFLGWGEVAEVVAAAVYFAARGEMDSHLTLCRLWT